MHRSLILKNLVKFCQFNINSRVLFSVSMAEELDPQQKLLLEEKCILVDRSDKKIGSASKRECHLLGPNGSPSPLHRVFSVFLFNSEEKLLLQQRSSYKITFPLQYTNTCCSHPLSVEEEMDETEAKGVKLAAYRRLMFELGIPKHEIQPSDFTYMTRMHFFRPSSSEGKWGEHEVAYILFLKKDVTLRPNWNEVKEVKYIGRDEFESFMENLKNEDIAITPWLQMIINKFLPLWWKNINNLDKFVDHKNIHYME